MNGRCPACGDWDCGLHGSAEDYQRTAPEQQTAPELVPCEHCDRLVYLRQGAWLHITGATLCHPWENDDRAEPSAAQSDERKAG
jgi:hypothetical protein